MTGVSVHDAVGVVCPRLSLQDLRQPLAFGVGVVPEVEEEEQENQAVQGDDVDEDRELVGAIFHEEILGDVAGHHDKLDLEQGEMRDDDMWELSGQWREKSGAVRLTYQLNGCEVFLPPQVLLVVGAHGSETIVGVHDDVDDAVQQGVEGPQTTWSFEKKNHTHATTWKLFLNLKRKKEKVRFVPAAKRTPNHQVKGMMEWW